MSTLRNSQNKMQPKARQGETDGFLSDGIGYDSLPNLALF
jgi:hypothetical protein